MKVKILYAVLAVIFAVSVLITVITYMPSDKTMVEIVQDGKVIQKIDISTAEDQEIRIDSLSGDSYNIIKITDGNISVSEAACPDKTCVRKGNLKHDNLPIVCLPNRLIIRFAEE